MIEQTERGPTTRPWPSAVIALATILPALLTGLFVTATSFPDTTMVPWNANMVDLEVYRLAGETLRQGADPYALPGNLPFLYPPFAALLAVPLSLLPLIGLELAWAVANTFAVLAIMYRMGVQGWKLALGAPAVIYFVEPVQQSMAFGQVGIFLVAMVVLDLVPGPRWFDRIAGRRAWPGWITGLATAVKLTPGLFSVHLWLVGRRRAALVSIAFFLVVTLVAAVIDPGLSLGFWTGLAAGDTGLGDSIVYYSNQSVMGTWLRLFGVGALAKLCALAACAVVAALGVVTAVRWHRRGEPVFAICLIGVTSLLASPVSWSHHFVWVVPMGLALLTGPSPRWLRLLTLVWVGWVAAAPFKRLPNGGDVELAYTWNRNVLDSAGTALGVLVLLAALAATFASARRVSLDQSA